MAFARNRIGVNYHKLDKNEKSLENHKMNIELSDVENVFAGYYNAGISLRTLDRHEKALEYFNRALEWSLSKQVNLNQIGHRNGMLGKWSNRIDLFKTRRYRACSRVLGKMQRHEQAYKERQTEFRCSDLSFKN